MSDEISIEGQKNNSNKPIHSKSVWLIFSAALIVILLLVFDAKDKNELAEPQVVYPEPIYTTDKNISYSLTIKNESPRLIKNTEVRVYLPVENLSSQLCCSQLSISAPYTIEKDSLGNQVANITLDTLPPYAQKQIQLTTSLKKSYTPNKSQESDLSHYLKASPSIEVNNENISKQAKLLKVTDDYQTAKYIHQWITANLQKQDFTRNVKGALYAFTNKKGDCTEYAYLFVAMARAAGIPSRAMGGYVKNSSGVIRAVDYHNWAEFYVNGAWHMADPHQAVFDGQYENYIATRIIGNGDAGEFTAHRYWYKDDGLRVIMN